jgi:hypothetical protein
MRQGNGDKGIFYIALSQIPLSKACHGAPGFEQSFQMCLGSLLELERSFDAVGG